MRACCTRTLGAVVVALTLPGCDQSAAAEPALTARLRATSTPIIETAAPREVVDQVRGVEVMVGLSWSGRAEVKRRVTPLSVTIRNAGSEAVVVRYEAFALVNGQGDRYAALPPFVLEGPVDRPRVVGTPSFNPRIATADYLVAPYCERIYAGIPAYAATFTYDPLYHRHYRAVWDAARLPSAELVERAIPEGVIKPGGSVSGYLYFQHVEPAESRLTFEATLANPDTGRRFGAVSIPLELTPT